MIVEDGSELAVEMWDHGCLAMSSVLSYPEGRAAFAAARRGGRLSANAFGCALEQFESLHGELSLIGVDLQLTRHAGQLAQEFALRGYDAVHLASALAAGDATTLVSWDHDLRQAAMRCECAIAPAD